MSDLPVDVAHIIGLALGLFSFGIYTGVFGATLMIMGKRGFRNRVIWCTLTGMYLLTTSAAICDNMIIYNAFVKYRQSPGTLERLNDPADPISMAKDSFWVVAIFVSDGLLLWRLRMVWQRNNFVFIPVLVLLLGSYAALIATSYYDISMSVSGDWRFMKEFEAWAGATFGLILASNVLMNALIAFRLWWLGRQVQAMQISHHSQRFYLKIIIAIVESGAIYSVFFAVFVILYGLKMINTAIVMYYILPSVVGVVPTLMILRMNWNPSFDGSPSTLPDTSPDIRWAAPHVSRTAATTTGTISVNDTPPVPSPLTSQMKKFQSLVHKPREKPESGSSPELKDEKSLGRDEAQTEDGWKTDGEKDSAV